MIESSFGRWLAPHAIPTRGVDAIANFSEGRKLIARARQAQEGIAASVAPELLPESSFLGQAGGPENRIEIELEGGEVIQLRGQGAGRRPTAAYQSWAICFKWRRLLLENRATFFGHVNSCVHRSAPITCPAFHESRDSMVSALQVNRTRNRFHVFSRVIIPVAPAGGRRR